MGKEAIQKEKGKVIVNIQREDVLASVSTLARTVEALAKVLTQTPQTIITHCIINGVEKDATGVMVQGMDKEFMREEEAEVE